MEKPDISTWVLEALVDATRRHQRLVAVTGTGSTMSAAANLNEWLVWALQIVTGSFERPGGAWFNPGFVSRLDAIPRWPSPRSNAQSGPTSRPELPRRNNEYPCAGLVDEIESGRIRALLVPGGNPIAAFPEVPRLRAALLGVMEFYKQEVFGQLSAAVVAPGAERRPLWWCFGQLAARLGFSCLPGQLDVTACSDEEVVAALARDRAPALREEPRGVTAARPGAWVTKRLLPGGRWRLAPKPLCDALAELPAPPGLSLIPGRQLRTMNSALRDVAAPRERLDSVRIHVAPEDARRSGVRDGHVIRVRSAHGEVLGNARIDKDLRAGTVWIPHGWLAPSPGCLTSAHEDIDTLTGMVLQAGLPVALERIEPKANDPGALS